MDQGPRLLIEWEPRSEGFIRSLGPAFSRSDRRLLIEVDRAPRPKRPIVLSFMLHVAVVLAVISAPLRDGMREREFVSPIDFHPERYEIVYMPSHQLPQMKDAGGAPSGSSGAAGGAALHTTQQAIRIARGNPVIPHVVDAPKLILPHTDAPANLLVSSAPAPSVPANAIQREKIMTVQAFAATSVVPPVPQVVRERVEATPVLPVNPIPPPVSTTARDTLAGSKLELPVQVAPPPKVKRDEAATLAAIKAGVPPPDVKQVNVGSIAPPPAKDTSVVVSSEPGDAIGKPGAQAAGAIAMSTTGAGKPGIGEGTGSSIGHGVSTGAATRGGGNGSTGAGVGSGDVSVQAGISPGAGPGGSGAGMIASAIPGVTISGGKVMLPSFGSTSPVKPGSSTRMPPDSRNVRPVTIVATASSGGAVSARGLLKGAKVYTIYMDTAAGLAFLQFAERVPDDQRDLTAPEPLMSKVPSDLRSARVLLAGVMDRSGSLRNLRIVEAASKDIAQNVIEAVQHWHFRPALRGDDPVEVDAIFGLNVDTR